VSSRGIPKEWLGDKIPLIQFGKFREDHFRESSGQCEDLQAILAKAYLKKRWFKESSSTLQRGHTNSAMGMGNTAFIQILEGMISQAIFQRKSLSLSVRFNFHREFHIVWGKREKAEEDLGLEMIL
jgi:hypothetical protein